MDGHVFIVQGDIRRLACDAWLLPTDAELHLSEDWQGAVPVLEGRDRVPGEAPEGWGDAVRVMPLDGVPAERPQPWPADVGHGRGAPPEWYAQAAREFVARVAEREDRPRWSRDRPLLALPVIGTGQGGAEEIKGDLLRALLRALHEGAREHGVDLVLVCRTDAVLAAAQSVRRRLAEEYGAWEEVEPWRAAAERLAADARRHELVVFLGGGVSAGAGLPLWDELVARLEDEAGLSPPERAELSAMGLPDRGRVLAQRLGGSRELTALIARWFHRDLPSLTHQILATLPIGEAATMNYDRLFEIAAEGVGRPVAVLPYEPAASRGGRWLLKLHGTVTEDGRARDIVLTRDDYLSYEERRAALAGIVQALLITRRMLFVGFSLRDDNFHRIVHEVRTAVGDVDLRPDPEPFGTALTLERAPLSEELWSGDLEVISLAAEDEEPLTTTARRLEVFLDLVLADATRSEAHLLDESFQGVLVEEEHALSRLLRDLEAGLERERLGPDGPAAPVYELLWRLGRDGAQRQ